MRVQVNERFDVPFLKKFLSRIIIISRIKADAANGNVGCMLTQFMECDQAIDTIMECGTGKRKRSGESEPGWKQVFRYWNRRDPDKS